MNITRFAIEKNRITYTIVALIFFSGYGAYMNMSRSQDPGFIIRTAMVLTHFPGASPERVEKLVTEPLEKAIQEMPELDFINSTSKTGVSIIYVNIKESYKEMRPIWDSLRRKVEREAPSLPEGIIGPRVDDEFGDTYGIIVSITGDGFSYAEMKDVADQVKDEFLLLDNVAKVNIIGAQEERVFLEYKNAKLAQVRISPYQFAQLLSSQNILTPGGAIRIEEERIFLEPTGNFESIEDIENAVISLPGQGEVIVLKDLVTVKRDYVDPASKKMYSSGKPALGLAVSMREGGNIIDLGDEIKGMVLNLQEAYPIGIEFDIVAFEPYMVDLTIKGFTSSLIQAVFVVMLTMVLFLGLRTGLVVATLIPSTILATFLVMGLLDIGLDKISLAALIISLGLLVDNAIVMSESCMVLMEEGKEAVEAAVQAASELKISLLTSSLTTAAAFLPIFLAKSVTGEYTASLFKVVSAALLCSWVVSLTLIPLLCASFLKIKQKTEMESFNSRFYKLYRRFLLGGLHFPWLALLAIIGVFFLSLQGFKYVPKSFFPESNQPMFTMKMELPTGTAIEETTRAARLLDAFVAENLLTVDAHLRYHEPHTPKEDFLTRNPDWKERDGVTNWTTYIGEGAPRFYLSYSPDPPTPGLAFFLMNVSNHEVSTELIGKARDFCATYLPDVKLTGQKLSSGPLVDSPIEVRISGRDTDKIFEIADQVKQYLGNILGTVNIDDNWGFRTKKLKVEVNQARARRAGLSSQDIAVSLQTMLSGLEITQYREGEKIIPVVLRSELSDREDIRKLEQLSIYSQTTQQTVPLRQIADIDVVWEAPQIKHRDRLRTVEVSSKLEMGVTPSEVEAQFVPWLEEQAETWEPGYRFELGGESESSGDSQKSIVVQLPIAMMFIILLLVSQFNSIRRPLIILSTLPLGVIGVVVGLMLTQASLGFMAFLGIISLSGIVINNAIVLIDRIDLEINELGHEPTQAIINAAQRRLRPILLTTITTLVGLVPLWMGGDPMFVPMAITIIFGLIFATVLTLGIVPVFYAIFFGVKFKDYRYEE